METIKDLVIAQVKNGAVLKVDYKHLKIMLDGKEFPFKDIPSGIQHCSSMDEWLEEAERLYHIYKYSRPSAASDKRERRARFKALPMSDLSKECGHMLLANLDERTETLAELELFIFLSIVDGSFKPQEFFDEKWFYQGQDKDFVLIKQWF